MAGPAENRPRGRPGLLSEAVEDALVAEIASGATLEEAARAVGIGTRTLRTWRARAWSARREDEPYVRLERRVPPRARRSWERICPRR